jgi:hypothetical protein
LHTSPIVMRVIKSRRMWWVEHVPHMGETRNAYNILVGKPRGKIPPGKPRHRWEDIKILGKSGERLWSGGIWFRIDTSDKSFWKWLLKPQVP